MPVTIYRFVNQKPTLYMNDTLSTVLESLYKLEL